MKDIPFNPQDNDGNVLHEADALSNGDIAGIISDHSCESLSFKVRGIIVQKYNTNITLREISRELAVNQDKIQNEFKREYGITIRQAIIHMRMQAALKLLENKELSVKQIAHILGYAKQGHFIDIFKRTFGKTPGQTRSIEQQKERTRDIRVQAVDKALEETASSQTLLPGK